MSKLLRCTIIFLVSFVLFTSLPSQALAQKSLSLEEQSQQVSRTDDVVQVTTATKSERATTSPTSLTTTTAATNSATASGSIDIPTGFAPNLSTYINWLLSAIIVLALLLAFFHFIMAGIEWITSGGDKSKTDTARSRITNVFIGIIILSASYAIVQFIAYILGFESLNDALNSMTRIQ